MKKWCLLGMLLTLFCILPVKSQATGWVWMNGIPGDPNAPANHLFDSYTGSWFYIAPAPWANVVNMHTGLWWKLEYTGNRGGWSYWDMPWIYCTYNNQWYWMAPQANWVYQYSTGRWMQLENHY